MSPRLAPALALALLSACGMFAGADDETGSSGAGTSSGVPTGGPMSCVAVDDCPAPALCEALECVDSVCTYTPVAAGAQDDDAPGDCRGHVCDGAGGSEPVEDPDDVPDDGDACTDDLCSDGAPRHVARAPGSACDGGFCHADGVCRPCPERDSCVDDSAAEPNETQSKAHPLPSLRDDAGLAYLCETLGGAGDVDWFTLDTLDVVLGDVAPAVVVEAPHYPDTCIYFQCKQGATSVACPEGATADTAPLGQQGCCSGGYDDGFAVEVACDGSSADATVWLKVSHGPDLPIDPPPPECFNYQVGYEY